jgi:rhodanese-related sulfurtransferase
MNKYLLIGLIILVVVLAGSIFFISYKENQIASSEKFISFVHLSPQDFNKALSGDGYTLIDVRTLVEYNAGHIKGAKEEDFYQTDTFSKYLDTLDKNGKYLIYCHTGKRSGLTLGLMQQKGFKNVYDLAGGFSAWESSNLPVEK